MRTSHTVLRVERRGRQPYYRICIGGRQHHLGTDQAEAYRRAAKLVTDRPGPTRPSKPATIAGLIAAWKSQNPHERNEEFTRPWIALVAGARIKGLCPNALRDYLADLQRRGLSQWTVLKYYSYAKRICEWAVQQGWLSEMPDRPAKTDLRPPPAVPRDYSHTDLNAVFANLPQRAFRPLYFILETGCRPGEARNLRWEQVDLENAVCVLQRHKTATSGLARTLILTPDLVELLREIGPKRTGWVFPSSRTGEPYTKSGLYAILRRAGLKHGVTSIYGLRHTRAQSMLDGGIGIGTVAEWLGHRDLRTVQTYAHIRRRHLRKAAEALPPIVQRQPLAVPPAKEGRTGPAKPKRHRPARRGSSPRKSARASMKKGTGRSATGSR